MVQIDRLWRVPLRVSLDGSMKRAACPLHPLRDHVDDHRLVFDIVVVKAVDKVSRWPATAPLWVPFSTFGIPGAAKAKPNGWLMKPCQAAIAGAVMAGYVLFNRLAPQATAIG